MFDLVDALEVLDVILVGDLDEALKVTFGD